MSVVGGRCFLLVAVLFVGLGFHSEGMATDEFSFQVDGFGSLGLSLSDSDSLGFIRDYHQKESIERGKIAWLADSDLGVQFAAQYANFSTVLQLLARERLDNDPYRFVNYAYIDVRLGKGFTLRLGKNPLELYLSSDNRAVGYSLLPLRPVSEFYTMLFEESYPGVDLIYRTRFRDGVLTFQGFTGTFCASLFPEGGGGDTFRYDPMVGFVAKYNNEAGLFSASYLWGNVTDVTPLIREQLFPALTSLESYGVPGAEEFAKMARIDDVPVHYFIVGASTEMGAWQLRGEANFFLLNYVGNTRMASAYLQAGYAMGNWTPYVILAGGYTKKDKVEIPAAYLAGLPQEAAFIADTANGIYKRLAFNQVSVNLGVRWDFHSKMAMKIQWGYYHVQGGGILLWNALDSEAYNGGDVNILSTSIDFVF